MFVLTSVIAENTLSTYQAYSLQLIACRSLCENSECSLMAGSSQSNDLARLDGLIVSCRPLRDGHRNFFKYLCHHLAYIWKVQLTEKKGLMRN